MRIAIAEFSQETDTFTPVLSDVSDFKRSTFLKGADILRQKEGTDLLDGVRAYFGGHPEVELVPVISAKAVSGGRLTAETVRFFTDELLAGLKERLPFDALLLSLHGATVSTESDDVCGDLLASVRELLGPSLPIVVPLDHHANITRRIMEHAEVVVGHETQPHDLRGTGWKGAATLHALLRRRLAPARAWVKIPMIAPQDRFLTSEGPMKDWFEEARKLEAAPGVFSISLFPMQPWVDVAEGGWTVVVYTEGDAELARSLACRLAGQVWERRGEFWVSERVPPAAAVESAVAAPEGLVIISDTGDAVYGGAPGDSTALLAEMVRQAVPRQAFLPLVDAPAVEKAGKRGLGAARLTVGGRHDPFSEPLTLEGQISAVSEGLRLAGDRGLIDIGKTALFEVGNVKIVLLSRPGYAVNLPILYTHLGLRIEDAHMVVLKTGSNFQYFSRWRKALIRADTPGSTQSDLTAFHWERLPRPIFPLDPVPDWSATEAVVAR